MRRIQIFLGAVECALKRTHQPVQPQCTNPLFALPIQVRNSTTKRKPVMNLVWQAEDSLREKKLQNDLGDLLKTMVAFANSVAAGNHEITPLSRPPRPVIASQ